MAEAKFGLIKAGKGTLIGNAGEYFVVGELLRRGVVAALAPRNTPGFDVIAVEGALSANIRVKSRTSAADSWTWMAKKDGSIFRDVTENDFTVMVDLKGSGQEVDFYVVRSAELEQSLLADYAKWLRTPGRGGRQRKEHAMRRCGDWAPHNGWLADAKGNWDLIIDWLNNASALVLTGGPEAPLLHQ